MPRSSQYAAVAEPEDRPVRFDDRGEDIPLDGGGDPRPPRRQHGRIEQVRTRVDVAGHQEFRLLSELLHPSIGSGHDETERARVVDVVQRDRDVGCLLAVQRHHRRQIQVGEDVTVEGEEGLVTESVEGVDDGAAGAQGFILGDPRDGRFTATRVDERLEGRLEVWRRQDHLVDAVASEVVQHVVQRPSVHERQQRLRHRLGQRP